jgi:hypothetical protein
MAGVKKTVVRSKVIPELHKAGQSTAERAEIAEIF